MLHKPFRLFRIVTSVPTLKTRAASSQATKFNVTKEGISKYQTTLACSSWTSECKVEEKVIIYEKKFRLITLLDQLHTAWICSCSSLLAPSCPNILTSLKKRSSLNTKYVNVCLYYSEQNSFAGRDCGFAGTFKLSLNWKAVKSLCLQILHLIVPQIWQKVHNDV